MNPNIVDDDLYARMQGRLKDGSQLVQTKQYEYLDESGDKIGAVARMDYMDGEKRKKTFIQADWCSQRKLYKKKADAVKTSLFNRQNIAEAETVVWVEGEKATLALQNILPDGWAAATNAGGATNAKNCNLSPLVGKKVIIWHDNDSVGKHSAMKLSTKLINQGIKVLGWVDVKEKEWEDKDDAFDIIERYGKDYTIDLLNKLIEPKKSDIEVPEVIAKEKKPFLVLGRSNEDDVVVYCFQDATIRMFSANSFDEGMMVKIYNDIAWWMEFCGTRPRSDKPNSERGFQLLWEEVLEKGLFEPSATRYGGIYYEDGEYIANLGDRLYVDGEIEDLPDRLDNGIYVQDRKSDVNTKVNMLTDNEAQYVVNYFEQLQCRLLEQRQLLLGWVVSSLLAPILPKRPHLWLYAPANTGKSYIANKMRSMVDPFAIGLDSSSTTFAGLKQYVQGRGCAVFWDESEAQSRGQRDKWDRVMEVVRVSFDASDGKIVQGSREQVAKFFVPRMMFCFSSVKMADFEETLSTRIIPVDLNRLPEQEMIEYFRESREYEKKINWDTLPDRLFKYVYDKADIFFDTYDKASEIFVDRGVDERRASSLAVCYSGYALMRYGKRVTQESLERLVWDNPLKLMPKKQSEKGKLRSMILKATVTVPDINKARTPVEFGETIDAKIAGRGTVEDVRVSQALHMFKTFGLEFYPNKGESGKVFVWEHSNRLSRIMGRYDGIVSVAPNLKGYEKYTTKKGLEGFLFDY